MAKKKYYYVLVCNTKYVCFVTKIDNANRVSYWDYKEKPLLMTKSRAEDMALGLNLNGHIAFVVSSDFEIEYHPYNYQNYYMYFKKRGGNKK